MSGKVEDRAWGQWTAEGAIPTGGETKAGKLTLKTVKPQQVTPELLRHVPFVNPNAWTHVGLAGTTPAKLELSYDAETNRWVTGCPWSRRKRPWTCRASACT